MMHAVPALMRKSQLFSLRLRRGLLPIEHFAVQGLPMFVQDDAELQSLTLLSEEYMRGLADNAARHLAGNAMALPAVGSVLLFVIAMTPARDEMDA